jgi:hypothetical protein
MLDTSSRCSVKNQCESLRADAVFISCAERVDTSTGRARACSTRHPGGFDRIGIVRSRTAPIRAQPGGDANADPFTHVGRLNEIPPSRAQAPVDERMSAQDVSKDVSQLCHW